MIMIITALPGYVQSVNTSASVLACLCMNFSLSETFILSINFKVRKKAKIRNQYNQSPHLTQDTHVKVTTSQLDITNNNPYSY